MPVRWPRRPAAVSEAVAAAGAGPDFSCAAGKKVGRQATERRGKLSLGRLCVCQVPVGLSVECGRVVDPPPSLWSGAAPLRLVGSCSRLFLARNISIGASFVSGCQSGVLFVCLLAYLLRQVPSTPSFGMFRCLRRRRPGWLARDLQSVWRVRTLLVVDDARELGVRGALFSLFAAVACFSCHKFVLIRETGVFVRLRLRLRRDARHRRPPPTPATQFGTQSKIP